MSLLSTVDQANRMEQYYRFHAKIYDATRWSFLFGRRAIIELAAAQVKAEHILEVGCGTGQNLLALARRFPQAQIMGLDISETMIEVARKKLRGHLEQIQLIQAAYDQPLTATSDILRPLRQAQGARPFDLILFSYSLSMMNPGWREAIEAACTDLAEGGVIAVVDFGHSPIPGFKRWMKVNHVRMDGHLKPYLGQRFRPETTIVRRAYSGLWQYFLFTGKGR